MPLGYILLHAVSCTSISVKTVALNFNFQKEFYLMKAPIIAIALLAVLSSPVMADGFYVLGGTSSSSIAYDKKIADAQVTRETDVLSVRSILSSVTGGDATGVSIKLGYQFNPNFAIEGGITDLGSSKYSAQAQRETVFGTSVSVRNFTTNLSRESSAFNIGAVGTYPLTTNFSLLGKLGVAAVRSTWDYDSTVPLVYASRGSVIKLSGTAGVGAKYKLSEKIAIRLDMDVFNADAIGVIRATSLSLMYIF